MSVARTLSRTASRTIGRTIGVDGLPYEAFATVFANAGQTRTERDAEGTGVSDSATGTISIWLDPAGSNTADWRIWGTTQGHVGLGRATATDIIQLILTNAAGTTLVELHQDLAEVGKLTNATGWTWLGLSWDNSTAGRCWMFMANADTFWVPVDCTIRTNDTGGGATIDWTNTDWGLGDIVFGTVGGFQGEMSEAYFSQTYFDLSVKANRDLFFNESGRRPAQDLSAIGSPQFYFKNPFDSFTTNSGSAGDFTKKGTTALTEGTPP